ncbi:hypothetical protein [Pseudobacteriovorax antillogorgiicola]|uniref:Uncharacterized protein n=1 Tax=Pseudobacteriovorax antillogorgiicola TaxID=1513793 RepID=A0A1Y6C9Q0_9BACT|nr:hypothetical protein [Pseudobacteriovorax antillogorgiicola]TCS50785.1 hypothetical protein EDD56_112168 [Pseudobacteriovorax antillogorgiicola]SMF41490.1 hypothetical protein SAMN06296036_112167 [Pseudobacteriovorax antillogorgiicola]
MNRRINTTIFILSLFASTNVVWAEQSETGLLTSLPSDYNVQTSKQLLWENILELNLYINDVQSRMKVLDDSDISKLNREIKKKRLASKHLIISLFTLAKNVTDESVRCKMVEKIELILPRYQSDLTLDLEDITIAGTKVKWPENLEESLSAWAKKCSEKRSAADSSGSIESIVDSQLEDKILDQSSKTAAILRNSKQEISNYYETMKTADFTSLMASLYGENGSLGLVDRVQSTAINFKAVENDSLGLDSSAESLKEGSEGNDDKVGKLKAHLIASKCKIADKTLECERPTSENLDSLETKVAAAKDSVAALFKLLGCELPHQANLKRSLESCISSKQRTSSSEFIDSTDLLQKGLNDYVKKINEESN